MSQEIWSLGCPWKSETYIPLQNTAVKYSVREAEIFKGIKHTENVSPHYVMNILKPDVSVA